ncbi:hypothetical protein [Acidisarcina polymorpha]|uniref:hypothetical protein n=1 Tax=Acidisarcina polymorpha TaxID=2211140 RepID=UPI000DF0198A|nr:hypothetical protein [Acidisarcina polymorpha]
MQEGGTSSCREPGEPRPGSKRDEGAGETEGGSPDARKKAPDESGAFVSRVGYAAFFRVTPQQFGHLRKPQIPEQPHPYDGFSPTLTVSIGAPSAVSAHSRRHSIPIHPPR